jgi:hypothetical protein
MNPAQSSIAMIIGCIAISAPAIVEARIYLSIKQVKSLFFPKEVLKKSPIIISNDLQKRCAQSQASGIPLRETKSGRRQMDHG